MNIRFLLILIVIFITQFCFAGKPSGQLLLTFETQVINPETGNSETAWTHYGQVSQIKFVTNDALSFFNSKTSYTLHFESQADALVFLTHLKTTHEGFEIIIPSYASQSVCDPRDYASLWICPAPRDYTSSKVKIKVLKTKETILLPELLATWKTEIKVN